MFIGNSKVEVGPMSMGTWAMGGGQLHLKKDGRSVYRDLSAAGLRRDLEYSLKRMDTDYLVIAWTIKHSSRFNVLCGARKPFQIRENAGALKVHLDDADYARMSADIDAVIAKKTGESTVV